MARLLRKIIKMSARDTPNVQLGLAEQAAGDEPSGRDIVPGVLSWDQYCKRRQLWDEVMQCIGLDGEFWEGSQSLMYPPEWLNESARVAQRLLLEERFKGIGSNWHRSGNDPLLRKAKAGACDPGEGGDANRMGTAWCIIDEHGILELIEERTTDTSVINRVTKMLLRKWRLRPERFAYDRGGGGKQHADQLRAEGINVRTVGFGEPATPDPKVGKTRQVEKVDQREDKYFYPSKRCMMYHELRMAIDPALAHTRLANIRNEDEEADAQYQRRNERHNYRHDRFGRNDTRTNHRSNHKSPANPTSISQGTVFGIPGQGEIYGKLRQELAPIPIEYDKDGKVRVPPKHKDLRKTVKQERSLTEIIGHSPDLADALVLAYHMLGSGMPQRARAGGLRDRRREVDYAE